MNITTEMQGATGGKGAAGVGYLCEQKVNVHY